MTVASLREVLNDPDLPPDTPVRVQTSHRISTWEWTLEGAYILAGPDRHLVLELRSAHLAEEGARTMSGTGYPGSGDGATMPPPPTTPSGSPPPRCTRHLSTNCPLCGSTYLLRGERPMVLHPDDMTVVTDGDRVVGYIYQPHDQEASH